MKNTLTTLILVLIGLSALGQTWTAGPKVAFGLSTSAQGDELRVGDNAIRLTTTTISSPTLFGGFVRYDRPYWYGQAEGLFGKIGMGSVRSNTLLGGGSDFINGKRADARLLAGVKPLPWLRLYAGAGYSRVNWTIPDYDSEIAFDEQAALERPQAAQIWLARADFARFNKAADQSYQRNIVMGQAGLGIDVHGVMVDLTYSQNLTPLLDGIVVNNTTYRARQQYQNLALSIGYRLLPTKAFLTGSRKSNRAYQRVKRDIPFYRNEVHALVGVTTDDFGRDFHYENRYTRYLNRRIGLAAGLLLARSFSGTGENVFLPSIKTAYSLMTGVRFLPLYSRLHTVGITTGPTLTYEQLTGASSGRRSLQNGQVISAINLRDDSSRERVFVGWQTLLDYNVAITDRLIAGPWLRLFGESVIPDHASVGIQAGYRF